MSVKDDGGYLGSRRLSSLSIASRMNSARLFGPATTSMRSACASVRRTSTGLVADLALSGGRPMRPVVADIGKSVNCTSKAISLIDVVSDIGYKGNIEATESKMTTWATYNGQSYKVKGKDTVVPNFAEMDSLAVRLWMMKNTHPRGYAVKVNLLSGMGSALSVKVQ